jgi:hypothetical protein
MSDEDKDEKDEKDWAAERGLVDIETRRQHSPELRMLDLIERLTARGEVNEEEAKRRTEETQRNMDFIVQQQAQFTADMQQLRELQTRSEQRWERTEESVRSLHAIAQIHEGEINSLVELQASYAESQTKLAEAQGRTDKQMSETDRRMAETDERINALVNAVERLISERRNGGQGA